MSTSERELAELGGTDPSAAAGLRRRAARISQVDVFAAADALLVIGERPTIDRVRMKLGRGSPNTINDHLDDWWAKLGARLRDLPGQEFPQLPDRVAQSLQQLWNEALAGAHEALQATLQQRELALTERAAVLDARERALGEREQANTARTGALEEALTMAREQLVAANQRAERLEASHQDREAEDARLRTRAEELERALADLRAKLDTAGAAHQAERARLEERHTAAEAHWLSEVDRARQATKEATKAQEQQLKSLRSQVESLRAGRETLRQQLGETRAELKAASAVREHLEQRLQRIRDIPAPRRSTVAAHKRGRRSVKTTRPG